MNLSEQITKNNLYKTFEPYIDPAVTMKERLAGEAYIAGEASEDAKQALAKWKAIKLKERLF